MSALDRLLLFLMVLLAAYQIVVGIDRLAAGPIIAYTIAFGVLLVAGLLLIILGFEVLDAPIVVVVSTIIPLALSLGLVWEHLAAWRTFFLAFVVAGLLAVIASRFRPASRLSRTLILAVVHGVAGLTIFLLPILVSAQGGARAPFALVGLGGALIGIGGLLLSFLKAGKPLLSREVILRLLPGLLLLMTACFVAGFRLG
jgi:hypothetical protein